jgi:hypothetical protein
MLCESTIRGWELLAGRSLAQIAVAKTRELQVDKVEPRAAQDLVQGPMQREHGDLQPRLSAKARRIGRELGDVENAEALWLIDRDVGRPARNGRALLRGWGAPSTFEARLHRCGPLRVNSLCGCKPPFDRAVQALDSLGHHLSQLRHVYRKA